MTELAEILASTPWLLALVVFTLGLLVGSFLNVVIHRLPVMMEREWQAQAEEILAGQASPAAPVHEPETTLYTEQTYEVLSEATEASHAVKADEALEASEAPQTPEADEVPASSANQAASTERYNLVVPRSRCPKCNAEITALQNIPVVSWLYLRGKCANCSAPISARYPIVELLTAVLSAAVALKFGWYWQMLFALLFTWSLVALTVIDIDHTLLPDAITLPLLWLGLLLSLFWHAGLVPPAPTDPRSAILGAICGYLALWSVYWVFKLVTGKEGMGYGDFKLLGALGAWMGWQMLPLILLLSAITGAVVGIALIVVRGRDRNVPIPFGPYLAAAGWIALMWGPQISGGYMAFAGLGR
jgi:leader peptidase (prepilin peptidase)/N-methyltransferase